MFVAVVVVVDVFLGTDVAPRFFFQSLPVDLITKFPKTGGAQFPKSSSDLPIFISGYRDSIRPSWKVI